MSEILSSGSNVTVNNLGVSFSAEGKTREVFSNINVDISSGQIVSVCGLSGIGKSTFLRVLAGLISATTGAVQIDSELITAPSKSMSFVSQDYSRSLFPWLTVEKNIALPFRGKKIEKTNISNRVQKVLSDVGLSDYSHSYPWQLSGGMQQRVAIARALVTRPRLLLLDEPFASVDAHTRLELEDLVLDLAHEINVTTIMVTHDVDEATYMSDRVFVMSGSPANFTKEITVNLPNPRSQEVTRSLSNFIEIRDELYMGMRQ
jgi:NitT/TauT family transport system ATP-binding protein